MTWPVEPVHCHGCGQVMRPTRDTEGNLYGECVGCTATIMSGAKLAASRNACLQCGTVATRLACGSCGARP